MGGGEPVTNANPHEVSERPTVELVDALRAIADATVSPDSAGFQNILRQAAKRLEDYEVGILLGRQHAKPRRDPFAPERGYRDRRRGN